MPTHTESVLIPNTKERSLTLQDTVAAPAFCCLCCCGKDPDDCLDCSLGGGSGALGGGLCCPAGSGDPLCLSLSTVSKHTGVRLRCQVFECASQTKTWAQTMSCGYTLEMQRALSRACSQAGWLFFSFPCPAVLPMLASAESQRWTTHTAGWFGDW